MKTIRACLIFLRKIAALGLLNALALRAESNAEPAAMLDQVIGEIMAIAYAPGVPPSPRMLADQTRPVLERHLDFGSLTRRAMGPGWAQFSADQKTRAIELFTALVVRTYTANFRGGERPAIRQQPGHKVNDTRWEIPTSVTLNGNTYTVMYRLEARGGAWRIHDIVIEGVSFVANYRAQFDALFQKGGAAAVLKALEAKQREAADAGS